MRIFLGRLQRRGIGKGIPVPRVVPEKAPLDAARRLFEMAKLGIESGSPQ